MLHGFVTHARYPKAMFFVAAELKVWAKPCAVYASLYNKVYPKFYCASRLGIVEIVHSAPERISNKWSVVIE